MNKEAVRNILAEMGK